MSLIDTIEKLRGKSDSVKRSVALGVSIVFTFLAVAVWVSFMFVSGSMENNTASVSNAKNNLNNNLNEPMTILKDIF